MEDFKISTTFKMKNQVTEKFKTMKMFNSTIKEYTKNRSDANSTIINKHLAHVISEMDVSIFDPHNAVAAEFFVNLHELMTGFDSRAGGLVWCAVSVVERACRNPSARNALIHTYRFVPILAKLLSGVVGNDKRIRLLTLMQDLTYGIKITWQEPHLGALMGQLTDWVLAGNDPIANLSLSIMVNLCYKNLPATYILTRNVDTKEFITSLVRLYDKNSFMQVHLCKMIIILENMAGEITRADLQRFFQVTVSSIEEAFKNRDIALLRHIVDFFIDMRAQINAQKVLEDYKTFENDVNCLLTSVEMSGRPTEEGSPGGDCLSCTDPTCMAMLFEFFYSLLMLDLANLQPLHVRLVTLALKWIRPEPASPHALKLLKTIAVQCTDESEASLEVLNQLSEGFTFFTMSLEPSDTYMSETPEQITSMIQLLLAMVKQQTLKAKVLSNVTPTWINMVFSNIVDTSEEKSNIDTSTPQYTSMYIHCLSLLAEFAITDPGQWSLFLIKLLRKSPIQAVIARGLYVGDTKVREQVLKLAGIRECDFPAHEVAKILCDLEPIVMATNGHVNKPTAQRFVDHHAGLPIMSVTQEGRLDSIIAKLEDAAAKNQLSNPVTSEVMELYEYKLAAMSHAERSTQSSLESAGIQITSMNHRIALMSSELARLHGMLYTSQLNSERLLYEKKNQTVRIAELEINNKESHTRLQNEREKRVRTVTEFKQRAETAESKLNSTLAELQTISAQYADIVEERKKLLSQNKELSAMLEKYEERYKAYKQKVEDREQALASNRKQNTELRKELETVEQQLRTLEKTVTDKDGEIDKLNNELKDLEQMRALIVSISTKKRL